MGHFGRLPIRIAWFGLVLPALLLNYFGQGALLLQHPEVAEHVFYRLAPSSPWFLYPLVGLATLATIIASQAVISGAFSLTRQAVQLGYSPRVEIVHTSEAEIGQIYVPAVNWLLMIAAIGLVLGFRTSSQVAAAYGMAVTTTMGLRTFLAYVVARGPGGGSRLGARARWGAAGCGMAVATPMVLTTFLAYVVAREQWGWSRLRARLLMGALLAVDIAFFSAHTPKIPQGGGVPCGLPRARDRAR